MAACLLALGVKQGDRVLIYMPMVPEAVFAMLACARIGAIHSVVFGGFASVSLASRIDDAQPTVIVSADAGSRNGKVVPYKPLLDEAIRLSAHKPARVLMVDRGLAPFDARARARRRLRGAARAAPERAGAVRLARRHAPELHALHQRHHRPAQGRAARHRRLRGGAGGVHEAHLPRPARRDLLLHQRHRLGRGPQLHRLRPADRRHGDHHVRGPAGAARRRHLVEPGREVQGHRDVQRAHRGARAEEARPGVPETPRPVVACARCSSPASRSTSPPRAGSPRALGKPIIDNYWQTETGWPILTLCNGIEPAPSKFGSPGQGGVRLRREAARREHRPGTHRRAPEGRGRDRRPAAARLHADRVARRRALRQDLLEHDPRPAWSTAPSTGASATRTATTSSSAAPTT